MARVPWPTPRRQCRLLSKSTRARFSRATVDRPSFAGPGVARRPGPLETAAQRCYGVAGHALRIRIMARYDLPRAQSMPSLREAKKGDCSDGPASAACWTPRPVAPNGASRGHWLYLRRTQVLSALGQARVTRSLGPLRHRSAGSVAPNLADARGEPLRSACRGRRVHSLGTRAWVTPCPSTGLG